MMASVWALGCAAEGPARFTVEPEPGAVEQSVLAPVVFHFDRPVVASEAVVQWNVHGENGRRAAQVEADGRDVIVTPFEPLPEGARHLVSVHGLADREGQPLGIVHTDFRTWVAPPGETLTFTANGDVSSVWRCQSYDGRGLPLVCSGALPGPDARLGTEDDEPDPHSVSTYTWEGYRQVQHEYVRPRDPLERGSILHNQYTYEYDDAGLLLREITLLGQQDGVLGTEDDLVALTERAWSPQGFQVGSASWLDNWQTELSTADVSGFGDEERVISWYGAGDDEMWATGDDLWSRIVTRYVDELGRVLEEEHRTSDGFVGGRVRDEYRRVRVFEYDEEGRTERISWVDERGTVLSSEAWVWGPTGVQHKIAWDPGPDAALGSEDDVLLAYEAFTWDAEGRALSRRSVGSPGDDGVWLTDDDRVLTAWHRVE